MAKVRAETIAAVRFILGADVDDALRTAGVYFPRRMEMAVQRVFLENLQGPEVEALRTGCRYLYTTGLPVDDDDEA